jgi:hypothetical protein
LTTCGPNRLTFPNGVNLPAPVRVKNTREREVAVGGRARADSCEGHFVFRFQAEGQDVGGDGVDEAREGRPGSDIRMAA